MENKNNKNKKIDEKYFKNFKLLASRPQSIQRDELLYMFTGGDDTQKHYKGMTLPLEENNRAIYLDQDFLHEMYEDIFNTLNSKSGFLEHLSEYNLLKEKSADFTHQVDNIEVFSNEDELLRIYKKFIEITLLFADFMLAPWVVEEKFDVILLDMLQEKFGEQSEEFYKVISSPTELHEYQKMRLAVCSFKINNTPIDEAVSHLVSQFSWIPEYSYIEPLLDENYFQEEIQKLTLKSAQEEYDKILHEIDTNKKAFLKIFDKINDETIKHYAKVVNKYTFLRTDRIDTLKKIQVPMRKIYKLIAEKMKGILGDDWDMEDVIRLTNDEIIHFLQKNKKLDLNFIRKRSENYIYVRDQYRVEIITDVKMIQKIKEMVIPKEESLHLQGKVAQKGVVQGKVALVYSKKDLSKVGEESILVARTTMVDYITAMKKAKGFVTAEGGVTSHAAIVSRELGKPCIVGTGNCMEVLNDGDLVEVDADNGVVRVLEKNEDTNNQGTE